MHLSSARRRLVLIVGLLSLLAGGAWLWLRPAAPNLGLCGAYRLTDGRLLFVSPSQGATLRYRLMDGRTARLYPRGGTAYVVGTGFSTPAATGEMIFGAIGPDGKAASLTWREDAGLALAATREPLRERVGYFDAGGLRLRGKLVLPPGTDRLPAVVMVHGSNDDSAVDNAVEPYVWAAHGFAGVVFDKRGTGESGGRYLQNFEVLAGDVAAAVRWARAQPEVDGERVQLVGFSQGGWIAPLAALADGNLRSLLVAYGPVVSAREEDRWGYVDALTRAGHGHGAIARADEVNAIVSDILDRGADRWSELGEAVDRASREPWFAAVKDSDSSLSYVASLPLFALRAYAWWLMRPRDGYRYIDRLYDPVPTLRAVTIPSLWLLGGKDSSIPSEATREALSALSAEGRPVQWRMFPEAEHGIIRAVDGAKGRSLTGYEPDYLPTMIEWLRRHAEPRALSSARDRERPE